MDSPEPRSTDPSDGAAPSLPVEADQLLPGLAPAEGQVQSGSGGEQAGRPQHKLAWRLLSCRQHLCPMRTLLITPTAAWLRGQSAGAGAQLSHFPAVSPSFLVYKIRAAGPVLLTRTHRTVL